jgi:hypothetical protein
MILFMELSFTLTKKSRELSVVFHINLLYSAGMKTIEEKIRRYEAFLHLLQLYAEVSLDEEAMKQLISNACSWSYAHRRGNGEPTEEEQQAMIDKAFDNLCEVEKN